VESRQRRLAENEIRFRNLNERLRAASGTWDPGEGRLELVCECGDENCALAVRLSPVEYEQIRADEAQFVVLPGHERPEVEDVVLDRGEWLVVRKRGEAAELAARADPRG
jgi:hypothetical protein